MIELRDFEQRDIEVLGKLLNNKNVTQYLTTRIAQPYTTQDAEWWVNTGSKAGIAKAIDVDGTLVGVISITIGDYENARSAEIGYWLGEDYWEEGIATKAVDKMTNYVFSNSEIVRLFAPVFAPNKESMHVLEKCGYIKEGIFKKSIFKGGKYLDEHIFAKINL
ncbi:MAG: GNAT family N-acetyltransferase [Gammaproteobacteria bacterium]|nr:GNAT family N-acetyltransferase [Gammaproteobacteria bacterium]MCF6363501.1 GNAT family N-acetyltransferase [Gammaproteobacteria bacterium]